MPSTPLPLQVPRGFRLTGVHCGVKKDPRREDLTLIVSARPATAAGVYTQNIVYLAPVGLDRERTPSDQIRVLVINSGNANACTGERGRRDAHAMARLAAAACGAEERQALVMSTGIIGEFLPLDRIAAGISAAAGQLGDDEAALVKAAQGILTTDTVRKLSGRSFSAQGATVQITGMAKGAGMIGPRMATMLCAILTDAPLTPAAAQAALAAAVERSFNCISVEGHMSTSDTVLLLASGAADAPLPSEPLAGEDLHTFSAALEEVCTELARAIPNDAEGASHLITIDVRGCATRDDARRIAKTIAESAQVKTAVAGADPNWGRIVSAAGYSGARFDPARVDLAINGIPIYRQGGPLEFDPRQVAASIARQRDVSLELQFAEGDAEVRFWTSDLTVEYIKINTELHT